jgi:hypothetical protein
MVKCGFLFEVRTEFLNIGIVIYFVVEDVSKKHSTEMPSGLKRYKNVNGSKLYRNYIEN